MQFISEYVTYATMLTLARLFFALFILPYLFVWSFVHESLVVDLWVAVLFLLGGLTDFFDGYIARAYGQETMLGKLLDPLADKVLVSNALIALVATQRIFFYWAILLIAREFLVMGLRLVAREYGFSVPVYRLAQCKTMLQMGMIPLFIINPAHCSWAMLLYTVRSCLLAGAVLVSLISAAQYAFLVARHFCKQADT